MKGPLLSTSFQPPLSQQGHRAHLVAGSQLLADSTQRGKDHPSVHISLFCCLCRLKGRCEGRQKLEALLLQLSQHEQPLLLLLEGGTLILWNLVSGLLPSKRNRQVKMHWL